MNAKDAKDAASEAAREKAAGGGGSTPDTVFDSGNTSANTIPTTPATPNTTPTTPMDVTQVTGKYPYNRAVGMFGGDKKAAADWLNRAVDNSKNIAGARWHRLGDGIDTNNWISVVVDGKRVSDTDTVIKVLLQSTPR
jgi:hypothetical protein